MKSSEIHYLHQPCYPRIPGAEAPERDSVPLTQSNIRSALRAYQISLTGIRNSANLSNLTYPELAEIMDFTGFYGTRGMCEVVEIPVVGYG